MKRTLSLAAIIAGALGWAAVTACNQTTITTPERSFDRPTDVALTCVQYFPNDVNDAMPHGTYNVRPLSDCETVRADELAITIAYPVPFEFIPPLGPANFIPFIVALVPQSARGELALVDGAQNKLIDLDPYTPDYGFLPVGKLPEHIRASADGCWALTSNTDSCDLSRIDVSTVVHSALLSLFPVPDGGAGTIDAKGVTPLPISVPVAGGGAPKILHARPSWVEMAPENDAGGSGAEHGYENLAPGQLIGPHDGFCVGGQHRAWVALPGCGVVVKVSLEAGADPTGMTPTVEQALRVTSTGVTQITDLTTLDCPFECNDDDGTVAVPDAGTTAAPPDMGSNLPTGTPYPAAIAVDTEADATGKATAGRIIIGDGYGERVDVVPFDVAAATFGTPTSVTLDPGDNGLEQPGVKVVRVGPRSEAGKFLYVVARDGTVRVIDLDRTVECETNPDPRWKSPTVNLQQTPSFDTSSQLWSFVPPLPSPRALGCFPLGDPSTPRRSPFATSPGIQLALGQLPTDVAFVHLDAPPADPTHTALAPGAAPGLLVGDFAWIITSNGQGTVVDIYDACPQPNQQPISATAGGTSCIPQNVQQSIKDTVVQFGHPQSMVNDLVSHAVRSGHQRFFLPSAESDETGMPRVPDHTNPCGVAVPSTSPGVPDGGVPDAGGCGSNMGNLPSLYVEPVPAELLSPEEQGEERAVYFVNPDHARNETWVLAWEGTLPGSNRNTGAPFVVADGSTPGLRGFGYVADAGGAWCTRGVLAADKLYFKGCTVDSECDNAGGFQCVHDPGAFQDVTQGMCLHIDQSGSPDTVDFWSHTCGKLLRSQRKYRILSARQSVPVPTATSGVMTTPTPGSTTDLLKVAEIYEPEFAEQTHTCVTDADCKDVTITTQVNPTVEPTFCMPDVDGTNKCLASCDPTRLPPSTVTAGITVPDATDQLCGFDFECVQSAFSVPGAARPDYRCVRAPLFDGGRTDFWQTCMPEVQQYEVHVGDAFTVEGTSSGYLSNEVVGPNNECIVPPQTLERVRLSQWRVPLSAPACPANVNASPLTESIDPSVLASNICALTSSSATPVRVIHFENPIFNIGVQLPLDGNGNAIIPPDNTSVSLGVTGGGSNLVSLLGTDVQAQQPRYVQVAPDGQTVYIVDEGKSPLATGLRGQLLRLFSSSQSIDPLFVVR